MIRLRVPIEDIENTISSPVALSVINELKRILFIDTDSHVMVINNETEYINKNWKAGKRSTREVNNKNTSEIEIEYETTFDESHVITSKFRRNRSASILYDENTDFHIKPLYIETIMNIKFKLKNISKIDLSNTLNRLRLRYISNRDAFYHDVFYFYYLPEFIKVLVNNIVYNRNLVYDDKITFEEYMMTLIDERFTLLNNLSGDFKSIDLGFKEVQTGVLGYFTTDILNTEKTFNKESNFWETELEYQIRFDQPMFYDIYYNTIAYQYELDEAFVNMYQITTPPEKKGYQESTERILDSFNTTKNTEALMELVRYRESYIRIPSNDYHNDIEPRELYTRLFSVQATISKEDKRSLFNFNDIPDIELHPDIMDFIRDGEYQYITKTLESFIQIEIYENDKRMNDEVLAIDEYLNVYSTVDLDLSKNYRVIFNVVENLNALTPDGKSRALENPKVKEAADNIMTIKSGVANTNGNFIRNLDIKLKLIENVDYWIRIYSYIIAQVVNYKG